MGRVRELQPLEDAEVRTWRRRGGGGGGGGGGDGGRRRDDVEARDDRTVTVDQQPEPHGPLAAGAAGGAGGEARVGGDGGRGGRPLARFVRELRGRRLARERRAARRRPRRAEAVGRGCVTAALADDADQVAVAATAQVKGLERQPAEAQPEAAARAPLELEL